MKKSVSLSISLVFVLILALTVFGCGGNQTSQENTGTVQEQGKESTDMEPIVLKFAHYFPATHPVETEIVQPWAKAVEEATDGLVQVKSYPGETLLKAAETYDGVVNGIADVGLSFFSYNRGRFPLLETFELPGIVYNSGEVAAKVSWEIVKEMNPQEIQDTKLMMISSTGPAYLSTKMPIRTLEDLKGVEIRTTGLSTIGIQALGAIPVAMPMSDAYEALSKSVVQGIIAPPEVLEGFKLAEQTGYVTKTSFIYCALYYITMNLDVWNSLPEETQKAIEEVNEKFHAEVVAGLFDGLNESGLNYGVENAGMEVITLSSEETDRWMKVLEPVQEESVAEIEAKGLPGREVLNKAKGLAEQYNEIYK